MAHCTNCGKKITWLEGFFFRLLTGDYTNYVHRDISTEAGWVLYCSGKCRDNDLRMCKWCKKYFSLKKTGAAEDDPALLICPNCSRKAEEVEQAHQKLVATMRSDEELTLLSYAEQHPEDSSGYLQLAYYYLDYGKKWQEYLSTREADLLYKLVEDRSLRWGYGEDRRRWMQEYDAMRYEIQPYHRAVETAFELASENLRKAVALGLDSLEEGKAHYWIAYMLRRAPQRHSISDPDMPSLDFYPTKARELEKHKKHHEKQAVKDANAALRASVKAIKRHLRSNPYDVEALRLLKSSYETLGKTNELYDVDLRLQKAEVLISTQEQSQVEQEPHIGKSGIPFEEKCLRLLQQMGFTASSTTFTNDGGIDIIAIHSQPILAGKYIIQCKDWKSNVGVAVVRELYGVANAEGANKGILITSSAFTKGAEEFAQGKPLELVDGEQLERLIEEHLGGEATS